MEHLAFNYLGKFSIRVDSPRLIAQRLRENIEGESDNFENPYAKVSVRYSEDLREIVKDKSFPYQRFLVNKERSVPGWDYFRYGTHVRSIWKRGRSYEVLTNIISDESAGLICFRNIVYNHGLISGLPLVHASLLDLAGEGILIAGESRSGKTSLLIHLLEEYGASFVSDENVLLESTPVGLMGYYLPRTVRVRFSQIADSPLRHLLVDPKKTNATQYIDSDAIERIINARAFHVDAGLTVSRRVFADSFGVLTLEKTPIKRVFFTEYSQGNGSRNIVEIDEIRKRLERLVRQKKEELNPDELEEFGGEIPESWLHGIRAEELKFESKQQLRGEKFNG